MVGDEHRIPFLKLLNEGSGHLNDLALQRRGTGIRFLPSKGNHRERK
jgi:hypothetical protein